jgi:hypothetical protein
MGGATGGAVISAMSKCSIASMSPRSSKSIMAWSHSGLSGVSGHAGVP